MVKSLLWIGACLTAVWCVYMFHIHGLLSWVERSRLGSRSKHNLRSRQGHHEAILTDNAFAAITIRGERNSGTNLVRSIIQANYATMPFELKDGDMDGKYGWKHGYIDIQNMRRYNASTDEIIVMVRDIWTWLVSTYMKSYIPGVNPQRMTFSEFLRAPYNHTYDYCWPPGGVKCVTHTERATNFIQLRTAKYTAFIGYPRSKLLKMEDLFSTDMQHKHIKAIVNAPQTSPTWVGIQGYAKNKRVQGPKYRPMTRESALKHYSRDDIAFVKREMNVTLEEDIFGYPRLSGPLFNIDLSISKATAHAIAERIVWLVPLIYIVPLVLAFLFPLDLHDSE